MAHESQSQSRLDQLPEINWLKKRKNPWDVPVLDVRPITLNMVSTTKDRQQALHLGSYQGEDGLSFVGIQPSHPRSISTDLRYRTDHILVDGILFIPAKMEHKWAIYYHQSQIIFVQSWSRQVQVIATAQQQENHLEISTIQGSFLEQAEDSDLTIRILDYLLRSHALDLVYPAPIPAEMAETPKEAAMWCFSCFGDRALVATPHELHSEPPEQPLRTHSLLHIAVARSDLKTTKIYLDHGIPLDLLARDGLAPLHWSLACPDLTMTEFLLSYGSPVDVRSSEGATPLMNAVQSNEMEKAVFLLEQGANPNAADFRGFTALHRAAELGYLDILQQLLEHGASPEVEAEGYTPRKLAELHQKNGVIELFDKFASAD